MHVHGGLVVLLTSMRAIVFVAVIAALGSAPRDARTVPQAPTVDDLLRLKTVSGVQISPDGRWIAYGVTEADFDQDAFVTNLWLAPADGGHPFQLTQGKKSATAARWSPDGKWIAFLSSRKDDKNQIFAIRPDGGEALPLTASETAISGFEWSPDGTRIAYWAPEPEAKALKTRKEQMGDFAVVRREYAYEQISIADVAEVMKKPAAGSAHTSGRDFSVSGLAWSPDGTRLAFAATINPDLVQGTTSDLYVLRLDGDTVKKIVSQPGPDANPKWSPDGAYIAFESAMSRAADFFHSNGRIAIVSADGGPVTSLTDGFDEEPSLIAWTSGALWFQALQKTTAHLFRLDVASKQIARVSQPDDLYAGAFTLSADASRVGFTAGSPTSMVEVFAAPAGFYELKRLTDMTAQLDSLQMGSREVISWKSRDGATIEGILIKPKDFTPGTARPLLVVIHGGPTGIDRPIVGDTRYYPVDAWVGRGALVLKVNYRGSAGYGEKFRELNVKNLGVGDAWDVQSGVGDLVAKGWVDPAKVGCMGWSQGGYISAFLTTSTTLCAAVSVGAGISNWSTYYYNTDITPFTIQYLGRNPAEDPAIYQKTSPMTYISQARTPTLIQHGENDRRVPIPNAYELRQGLEDRGVPVEMVVYKGFGHGITKPKSQRAVMTHNLQWFNHYIFGDAMPDLTSAPGSLGVEGAQGAKSK
jgi:dipeptidyl aminopeptidase/acylaminoacyl peptidase